MLYHALAGGTPGVDIEQILCTLHDPLDTEQFRRAWAAVSARHEILRARMVWEGTTDPFQVPEPTVDIEQTEYDWSDLTEGAVRNRLEALLAADRHRGFDLRKAPLMRLAVVRTATDAWYCLWTFHHILLDGRSFPVILREVFGIYEALLANRPLPPAPAQPYSSFLAWLDRQDPERSRAFWQETLHGFSGATTLPFAGLAPTEPQEGVRAVEVRLPAVTTTALRRFAETCGVTLNTLVQGAWALLLHHYSREDDIVFGATRACRRSIDDAAAAGAVGLLINTLPVRVRVTPDDQLVPWLQRLRTGQVAVREHEHTPLPDVQRWSDLPSGTPLFRTLVVFENYLLDTALRSLGGTWERRRFRYIGQTNYPLALIAYADAGLLLRLEYDTSLYVEDQAEAMLRQTGTLLAGMLATPEATAAAIPYTTAEERAAALRTSGSRTTYPVTDCLHQRFERLATERPDAVAVTYRDQSITYRELDHTAERLASRLRALGVGRDVLVGLCIERSPEMVVGILGILKAGGAYVPIDPAYPPDRIAYILDDADVAVLIAQDSTLQALPAIHRPVVTIDHRESWDTPVDRPAGSAEHADPSSLAYVIYTSGSTGKPKGVLVTHANVMRLFDATNAWFGFGPTDVWTLFHSSAFDFSVWEFWGALAYGGRVVVVPYLVSRSPDAFLALLAREGVTVLNQTPSAFQQLVPVAVQHAGNSPLALRLVIFGGEALDPASLGPWVGCFGAEHPRLVNMYGITETTIHVTYRPLSANDVSSGRGSVIGQPVPDLELLVLDASGRPVPVGVPGELYVGGGGLARGYLNRPELTAERFIAHPFDQTPGARLYRTGDVARRLSDGDIEYLGRADDQVKIRGFRIELGEVDAALGDVPLVGPHVTIVREDQPGVRRLVSYYVPIQPRDEENGPRAIRAHLAARLPAHMIPAAFVPLDALPLTTHGKIDRKQLPVPTDVGPPAEGHVAPRNAVEEALARIWEAVLRRSPIGVEDNFFELGGDSILSIQIVSRARAEGIVVTPRDVLLHPTVAGLAEVGTSAALGERNADAETGTVPLTPIQLWWLSQDLPAPEHWNQSVTVRVVPCDRQALQAALDCVVRHHATLRLRFERTTEGWRQFYDDRSVALDFRYQVLSGGADRDSALERVWSDAQLGFDLARGPLFRAALVEHDETGTLVLVAHHAIIDAVSWQILLDDLTSAYAAMRAGRDPVLPAPSSSFKTWSEALTASAIRPDALRERAFWTTVTAPGSLRLPRDGGGPNLESSVLTDVRALGPDVTAALLGDAHHAYHTRGSELLLATFARTMSDWAGSGDVLLDLEGHGREPVDGTLDLTRTVGWFTTIFPVRLRMPAGSTAAETIMAVKEQLRAVPRNGIGYGILRFLADGATRLPDYEPDARPEVAFNYLGQTGRSLDPSGAFAFGDRSIRASHAPDGIRPHVLEVIAEVLEGRLVMQWHYSSNIHAPASIAALADAFESAARAITAHCLAMPASRRTPSDYPAAVITQDEVDRLVAAGDPPDDITVLSPMQDLFYAMDSTNPMVGFEQWRFRIDGPVSPDRLHGAWQAVVGRHEILRSSFVSAGLSRPHRVVRETPDVPFTFLDWRGRPESEQRMALEALLDTDRRTPFDLTQPPLTRVTLIRRGDADWEMVWSTHHLAIDGWSWPLVISELARAYREGALPRRAGLDYGAYVGWLMNRDTTDDHLFWQQMLDGVTGPTRLPGIAPVGVHPGSGGAIERGEVLPTGTTQELVVLSRKLETTLGTLIQGAWALVLSRWSGRDDVIFGAAYAGRPADLRGAESVVGPFVNNLPIRARLTPTDTLAGWLTQFGREQIEVAQFQHAPLRQIHGWSGVSIRDRLFDSLVVVQNYVVDHQAMSLDDGSSLECVSAPDVTGYPVTVIARPGRELALTVRTYRMQGGAVTTGVLLGALRQTLERMERDSNATVASICDALDLSALAEGPSDGPRIRTEDRPATDLEALIVSVLREAFGDREIGLYDNFFDLGAHSLLLLSIHAALEERLGRSFPVTDVFEHATISDLAKHLGDGGNVRTDVFDAAQQRARQQRERLRRHAIRRGGGAT